MSRTARLWKGVGPLTLGGLLLSGGLRPSPTMPRPSEQLIGLGRQAAAQGQADDARSVLPQRPEARPEQRRGPIGPRPARDGPPGLLPGPGPAAAPGTRAAGRPRPPPPAWPRPPARPSPGPGAAGRSSTRSPAQQFTNDIRQRLQAARDLTNAGNPDGRPRRPPQRPDHRPVRRRPPRGHPPPPGKRGPQLHRRHRASRRAGQPRAGRDVSAGRRRRPPGPPPSTA